MPDALRPVVPLREQYYRQAGCWSLAFELVAFGSTFVLGYFNYSVTFIFGVLGLLFAISGLWKGGWGARICALVSLLVGGRDVYFACGGILTLAAAPAREVPGDGFAGIVRDHWTGPLAYVRTH